MTQQKLTVSPFNYKFYRVNNNGRRIEWNCEVPELELELRQDVVEPQPPAEPPVSSEFQAAVKKWEDNMFSAGTTLMSAYKFDNDLFYFNGKNHQPSPYNFERTLHYYDGSYVFYRVGDFLSRMEFVSFSDKLEANFTSNYEPYGVRPYGETGDTKYGLKKQGRWVHASGFAVGGTKEYVLDLCHFSAYAAFDSHQELLQYPGTCRTLAYLFNAFGEAKRLGLETSNPYMSLESLSVTVMQYAKTLGSRPFELCYMLAMLSCEVKKHELQGTLNNAEEFYSRIANFITPHIDSKGSVAYGIGDHPEAHNRWAELNLMIAPALHYGGYVDTAERVFIYGVNNADLYFQPKTYNQNYLYSIDYVEGKNV